MHLGPPESVVSVRAAVDEAAAESKLELRASKSPESAVRLVDSLPIAALLADADNRIVAANSAFHRMLGYAPGELQGAGLSSLGNAANQLLSSSASACADEPEPALLRLRRRAGGWSACLASVGNWQGDGSGMRLLCAHDCTQQVRGEQQLGRLAFVDELTGLPNRAAFVQRLRLRSEAADEGAGAYAVARIDLDRFRLVNDTHGHQVGDQLLAEMAERLRQQLDPDEFAARMGEDEFALLVADSGVEQQLRKRLDQILSVMTGPYDLQERRVYFTASVGVVRVSDPATSADEVLNNADSALFRAKGDGRNRITLFEPQLQAETRSRLVVFSALQRALRDSELEIHIQPIVDGRTGTLVTMEALVRWPDTFLGACQPSQFIPVSEELGLAPELDRLVIEEAARWLAYLRQADPRLRGMPVNINLSAVTLRNEAIVEMLDAAREQYGLEPQALRVEITETALLSDSEHVKGVLRNLAHSGTPLVLDDFGTGYSSLRHVYDLPICGLKIDKYFVHRSLRDPRSLALVRSILSLANALGISTTAEGIESERQRATLVRLGCQNLQGYLFAKPMPPADLPAWLDRSCVEKRSHG